MGLEENNFLYETLLKEVRRLHDGNDPRLIPFVEATARVAWKAHPGRFADGALENILLEAGMQIADSQTGLPERPGYGFGMNSRTLHVATAVYATGGHSRMLTKWVQHDLSSSPAIVLTRQTTPVPAFLSEIWSVRKVVVTLLNANDSILDRARQLRAMSTGFDRVILHHDPDDSVPVIAYSKPGGAPVAMFNHAHFWFCLGSSVSDIIINTLPYFQGVTKRHRFPRSTALFNGEGLDSIRWSAVDKKSAKMRLGLPENSPVVMTIAKEHYFKPMDGYDFFKTVGKLLELRSDLHLLAVGVSANSTLVPETLKQSGRVHLVGLVSDPRPYYEAADICLESFPMSSLGGFCEAVAYGEAFPVPVYGPGENVLRITQSLLARHAMRMKTEAEYLNYISELIESGASTREKAADQRKIIIAEDEAFGEQFGPLYRQIDALRHEPGEIPVAGCCTEDDNRILASFTDPNVGPKMGRLLPFFPAVIGRIQAVVRGYDPVRLIVGRSRDRCCRAFRRLTGG